VVLAVRFVRRIAGLPNLVKRSETRPAKLVMTYCACSNSSANTQQDARWSPKLTRDVIAPTDRTHTLAFNNRHRGVVIPNLLLFLHLALTTRAKLRDPPERLRRARFLTRLHLYPSLEVRASLVLVPSHVTIGTGLEVAIDAPEDVAFAVDLTRFAVRREAPAELRVGGRGRFEFGVEVSSRSLKAEQRASRDLEMPTYRSYTAFVASALISLWLRTLLHCAQVI